MNCTEFDCTEFERAANERLDARHIDLDAALRDHLVNCPACQSFWRGQQALLSAISTWKSVAPPSRLIENSLHELTEQNGFAPVTMALRAPTTPTVSRGGVWALVCSSAALALLAVSMVRWSPSDSVRALPVAQVESQPVLEIPRTAEAAKVSDALSGLLQGVPTEYVDVSRETTRALADFGDLAEAAPWLSTADEPRPESTAAWMRLDRPVSERVGQAFDFLWDALPREAPPL
jgi:hypothetical protein